MRRKYTVLGTETEDGLEIAAVLRGMARRHVRAWHGPDAWVFHVVTTSIARAEELASDMLTRWQLGEYESRVYLSRLNRHGDHVRVRPLPDEHVPAAQPPPRPSWHEPDDVWYL